MATFYSNVTKMYGHTTYSNQYIVVLTASYSQDSSTKAITVTAYIDLYGYYRNSGGPFYGKKYTGGSLLINGSGTSGASGTFPASANWSNTSMVYDGYTYNRMCSFRSGSGIPIATKTFTNENAQNVSVSASIKYASSEYAPSANMTVSGTLWIPSSRYTPSISISGVSTSTTTATVNAASSNATSIQYSKDNGNTWQSSNYFSGLTPGTTYNFKAKAQNGDSDWAYSSAYSATTSVPSYPTYTRSVSGITRTSATLNVSVSSNPDSFWRLHWYSTSGGWAGYSGNGATGSWTYTQSDLTPNTSYNFYTQVTDNSDGRGTGLSAISFTTSGNAPTLSDVSVSAARTKATLTPSASYDTNASYKSCSVKYGTSTSYGSTSTSQTLSNLTPNTTYYYSMTVTDDWGRTSSAKTGSFTTTGNSPSISSVSVSKTQTTAILSISTSYDTNASFSSREIQYGTSTSYGTTTTSNTLTGLTPGTTYYVKIRVKDNWGRWSSYYTASFKTANPDAPTIDMFGISDITATSMKLTWETSYTSYSSFSSGAITYAVDGTTKTYILSSASGSTVITGLSPSTTYQFTLYVTDNYSQKTEGTISDTTLEDGAVKVIHSDGIVVKANLYKITTSGDTKVEKDKLHIIKFHTDSRISITNSGSKYNNATLYVSSDYKDISGTLITTIEAGKTKTLTLETNDEFYIGYKSSEVNSIDITSNSGCSYENYGYYASYYSVGVIVSDQVASITTYGNWNGPVP